MIKKLPFLLMFLLMHFYDAQGDCTSAIPLCGNSSINYTPNGVGSTLENIGGCLDVEHNSVWYKFTIATSGTLTFDLAPVAPIDYDWAIYGPNTNCGSLGAPIRCNASGYFVATGMNFTNTNTSSGAGNTDPYCQYMNVVAGQSYYLVLDNYNTTVETFNLTWGGTATFVSAFNDPTLTPNPFVAPGNPSANPNSPNEISVCSASTPFNFDSLSAGIINGNPNFVVHYFTSANGATTGLNPIISPTAITANTPYYYTINYQDPNNPNNPANSCKQSGSFVFVENPIIAVITGSSTILCPNGSITLTSNHTSGNLWSTGETTPSITVNNPGNYTLTVSNGVCTSLFTNYTVVAATNPNVQISGNLVLCSSGTTLTATSTGTGNTYAWSNGVNTAINPIATAGNYTVTVTTSNGCQYTKTVTVSQGSVPIVQNATLSICYSTTNPVFDLTSAQPNISTTAGAVFSYYQNLADANAANTNTIANPTAYTPGNTTIYVLVSIGECSKVATLQLIATQIPVATISSSNSTICNGNAVTLTSNLPTGNLWSTGQTSQSISVNTAGTYTLTNTNGSCTSALASVTITDTPNPNLQIIGNLSFCNGTSTTLTATASGTGNTYTWSNGTTGATNTVTTGGTYTVTVTTASGCTFQQSVTVVMQAAILVNIAAPAQITCATTQITLNASASVFPAGSTILWTATGGGNIISGGNTLTPIVNSAGTYTCTITSNLTGNCSTQSSVNVTSNINPPTITLSASSLSICVGESTTLSASGAQSYTWNGLPGSGNTQLVSPTTTTTYSVTGIGANGCSSTIPTTITITVVPKIVSTLVGGEICKGDDFELNAGTGPNFTYLWSTGETTQQISVNIAGNYSVTISNGVCSQVFSAMVNYKTLPEIQNITLEQTTLVIIASIPSNQPLEYSIDGGSSWQDSNTFSNILSNQNLLVSVRVKGEICYATTSFYTFIMQNVITPNSDGYNDVVDFSTVLSFDNSSAEIYNRYGKVVFKATKKNPIWNGTENSRKLPTSSYWYIIKWENKGKNIPTVLQGWILLKNRD